MYCGHITCWYWKNWVKGPGEACTYLYNSPVNNFYIKGLKKGGYLEETTNRNLFIGLRLLLPCRRKAAKSPPWEISIFIQVVCLLASSWKEERGWWSRAQPDDGEECVLGCFVGHTREHKSSWCLRHEKMPQTASYFPFMYSRWTRSYVKKWNFDFMPKGFGHISWFLKYSWWLWWLHTICSPGHLCKL